MNSIGNSKQFGIWQSQATANLVCYVLIGSLLVFLTNAFVWLVETYASEWNGSYLPFIAFLLCLEAMYFRNIVKKRGLSIFDRELWIYRGSELVVLIVGIRFLLYVINGTEAMLNNFRGWPIEWYRFFEDTEFFGVIIFLVAIWGISNSFGFDIDRLQVRPSDENWERISELNIDRNEARKRLFSKIMSLGVILILLTIILRVNAGLYFMETYVSGLVSLNMVAYFGISVILLSFTQFSLLLGRWLWEGTQIEGNLGIRWFRYGAGFVLILIAIAYVLPTAYTYGFLEVIRFLLSVISYIIALIYFLIMSLVSIISVLTLSLFGREGSQQPPAAPTYQLPEGIQSLDPNSRQANSILSLVFSLGSWILIILVIGFSFWFYVKQNVGLYSKIKTIPFIGSVIKILEWLRVAFLNFGDHVKATVNHALESVQNRFLSIETSRTMNYISLRKLSPREKIIFYYLAFIKRTGEGGVQRELYATPNMFKQKVDKFLPNDASQETSLLTQAFYEARYSKHQLEQADTTPVKSAWSRLRIYLRKLRSHD